MEASALAGLRPAFRPNGTVTAGNVSGINDGAAALVVMSRAEADRRGTPVLARIAGWASAGVDPSVMGSAPFPPPAARWAGGLVDRRPRPDRSQRGVRPQPLAVECKFGWDAGKANVNGGAIAIGHPISVSRARVLTMPLHEMRRRGARKGLATLCTGNGMGVAPCVERRRVLLYYYASVTGISH